MENYAVLTAAREQYDVYVVQDLEDFVAENRYPTAQSINADGSIIDMELVNAYDQKLTEYTAHGGTADATDAYAYAEKVVSLKQYEPQLEFLRNASEGHGIIKMGNSMIPFSNLEPKDTAVYKLITTKPGEATAEK